MRHRTIAAAAIAATLGIGALAPAADAAWRGLKAFDCETSRSNWNFDGLYGNYTTRAIRNFQRAKGIKVDGVAGPETYRALGLRYRRSLKCGMGGNDVFLLQQALAASGFWYGGLGDSVEQRPGKATPKPRPTPAWTEPPIIYTPMPLTTEEPTPEPEETPMELPSAAPSVESVAPPENTPTLELHGGNWMVPLNAGATNYDYTFTRPTWVGGGTLWLGDVGLGGDVSMFNQTFVDFRNPGPALTPYFAQNTAMYDALLKFRMDHGFYQVFGGYRGIGRGNVNFGTLGLAMDRPLLGHWLWLQAKAQGGHNLASSYFADGRAGLGLRVDPLSVELGFRHFAFQNLAEPMFHLNGPVAEVRLAF